MKRSIIKGTALFLMAVLLISTLSGCANKEVKDLIGRFETSCQAMDVDGMLDCCNPTIVKPLRGVLGILGVKDLNGIVDSLSNILGAFDLKGNSPEDVLKTVKITPTKYETNSTKDGCSVQATITYVLNGKTVEKNVQIACTKGSEGWYISSIG